MDPLPPSFEIPERLETHRLILEPYRPGDGAWLHAVLRDDRGHLADALDDIRKGLGLDLTDPREAELFVRQLGRDWAARRRFVFAVREKTSRGYVGELWVECLDWSVPLVELGYFVVEAELGKGYATEAARAGLRFGFAALGAEKVRLTCDADNVGSTRVAERCGFVLEGRHRSEETRRGDGTRVDRLDYGMRKSEYDDVSSIRSSGNGDG